MFDSTENRPQEKYVMHCVKIPALNSWTHQVIYHSSNVIKNLTGVITLMSCLQFKYTGDQDIVSSRNEKRKLDITIDDTMEVDS